MRKKPSFGHARYQNILNIFHGKAGNTHNHNLQPAKFNPGFARVYESKNIYFLANAIAKDLFIWEYFFMIYLGFQV